MEPLVPVPAGEVAADPSAVVAARARQFADAHARFEARRDSRAVCVLGFSMMYEELADHLAGNAYAFDDPDWVARLADAFAGLAFEAFDGIDRAIDAAPGAPDFTGVPRPWADAWTASALPDSTVLDDLIGGLVAHIGHDLPVALARVGLSSNGTSRVADFHRLNDVLSDLVDSVQRAVSARYNRYLLRLDRLAAGADEGMADLGMRVTRALAWYNATRLLDPSSSDAVRAGLECCVEETMSHIRRPRRFTFRVITWCGRRILRGRRRWPTVTG